MPVFNTKTSIVAGKPIEVKDRHFLPSVLVTTAEVGTSQNETLRGARIRPISVIEKGPDGNRWYAIPNTTKDKLSIMAAIGLCVALVGSSIILLARMGHNR